MTKKTNNIEQDLQQRGKTELILRPLELGTPQMQFDSFSYPPKPTRKTPGRKRRRPL